MNTKQVQVRILRLQAAARYEAQYARNLVEAADGAPGVLKLALKAQAVAEGLATEARLLAD
jgi:hypothetical protein